MLHFFSKLSVDQKLYAVFRTYLIEIEVIIFLPRVVPDLLLFFGSESTNF